MIRPGDVLALSIEKPAAGGRMIARHEGRVILVSGAIPGERVTARVSRAGGSVVYAESLSIDEPSPDRRAWAGDALCGGCAYGHIEYARQLEIKAAVIADAFRRIGRLPLEQPVAVAASAEHGYRMRARLHVRGHRCGFFREGTHEICDARQTRQLLDDTSDAVDRLAAALRSQALEAVTAIELAENVDASSRAAFLDASSPIESRALERVAQTPGFSGLLSGTGSHGSPWVVDAVTVGGSTLTLRRHVRAFFQGNRFLFQPFVDHVSSQVPAGADVLDLYAGGGVFSLAAATARGSSVTAVEGDRWAAADLAANAAASSRIRVVHRSVEEHLEASRGAAPQAAIVDPPRTGLSPPAVDGLVGLAPGRIVYVSCDTATLARDARRLADAGYRMGSAQGFDLFPNTPHVEVVAVFDR
ncbi:MAG TPA: RsmD family RNA methyltransferase [Vicinamibacterales bacterium]|nr:RsmD family RNA methyltransferase [Vicinamibacterales bacterium]